MTWEDVLYLLKVSENGVGMRAGFTAKSQDLMQANFQARYPLCLTV
ncbi:MAG: hypothetical protein WCF90_09760 [Methanomicrobiales archaeon]